MIFVFLSHKLGTIYIFSRWLWKEVAVIAVINTSSFSSLPVVNTRKSQQKKLLIKLMTFIIHIYIYYNTRANTHTHIYSANKPKTWQSSTGCFSKDLYSTSFGATPSKTVYLCVGDNYFQKYVPALL